MQGHDGGLPLHNNTDDAVDAAASLNKLDDYHGYAPLHVSALFAFV
jgi:hypothetical protein